MRAMVKKLAMLLATVNAAMIDQKERKCEGVCRGPSLTCPAIVVGKMLEDCKGQCEVV
jgi:hypothetical protein